MASALFPVLHEDDELLVIDKPAGLVCHPSKDGPFSSVIGRVRLYLGNEEGRLVNRLDRETSGVLLVAKSAVVASELGRVLASGAARKRYVALVHGDVGAAPLRIVAPLGKDEESAVAIKDGVRPDGVRAETLVRRVHAFAIRGATFSSVTVVPDTGRKHQIRIHLAHIGHPIIGDKIYGADDQIYLRFVRREMTAADRAAMRLDNHALHAASLAFDWKGRAWTFDAPPRADMEQFMTDGNGALSGGAAPFPDRRT